MIIIEEEVEEIVEVVEEEKPQQEPLPHHMLIALQEIFYPHPHR